MTAEQGEQLGVVAVDLGEPQRTHPVHQDLLHVRLLGKDPHHLVEELLERHRGRVVGEAVHQAGLDGGRHQLDDLDARAGQSRLQAAGLRAALSRGGTDRRAAEIVRRLLVASPEFAAVWERHEVSVRFDDHKTLVHPELGELDLDCQALFTENQAQVLLVLTAARAPRPPTSWRCCR